MELGADVSLLAKFLLDGEDSLAAIRADSGTFDVSNSPSGFLYGHSFVSTFAGKRFCLSHVLTL